MIWLLPMSFTLYYAIYHFRLGMKKDKNWDVHYAIYAIETILFVYSTAHFFKEVIR